MSRHSINFHRFERICFFDENSSCLVTNNDEKITFYNEELIVQKTIKSGKILFGIQRQNGTGNFIAIDICSNIVVYGENLLNNTISFLFRIKGKFWKFCTNFKGEIFTLDATGIQWFDSCGRLIKKIDIETDSDVEIFTETIFVYIVFSDKILKINLETGPINFQKLENFQNFFTSKGKILAFLENKKMKSIKLLEFSKFFLEEEIAEYNNIKNPLQFRYGNSHIFLLHVENNGERRLTSIKNK